jgi:serine/threonine-protein kinase
VALLALLLLLGGAAAAYVLTRPVKKVVPNVVSEQLNNARTVLQNAGFSVSPINVTSAQPQGVVIAENPPGGTKADEGSTVTLTVSQGPGNVNVPSVTDLTLAKAKRTLKRAGLKVGRIVHQSSDQISSGDAIGTDPGSGQPVLVGTSVTLIVSNGKPKVSVPDVTGDNESQAKSTLQGAGFTVTTTSQTTTTTPAGQVISQNPQGGTQVAPGSTITLVVAKAPTTESVPDVKGQSAAAATSALQAAGFKVTQTSKKVTNKAKNGVVVRQSPGGGSSAKKGSTVTIVVGQYTASPSPSTTPTTPTTPTTSTTPTTPTTP